MRSGRLIVGAATLVLMCGTAFGQADGSTFESVMNGHAEAWAAMRADRSLNAETATTLNQATIAKLDMTQVSLEQIAEMMERTALYGVYDNEGLAARMATLMNAYGAAGASAKVLNMQLLNGAGKRDEAAAMVGSLLSDPAVGAMANTDDIAGVIGALAGYAEADDGANYMQVAKFMLGLPDDMTAAGVGSLRQAIVGMSKVVDDETRAMHKQVLARAIDLTQKQMEKLPENKRERLQGALDFYEGPYARGELMNNQMPQMDIVWASNPEVTSMEAYRGKVLVLDFWATWCGPCIASFPNIKKVQDYYADYDVAIVGVTSLQGYSVNGPTGQRIDCEDNPELEYEEMVKFMEFQENMNWQVVFTEQSCFNADFGVFGIPHMAIVDPSGKVRHGGIHPGGVSFEDKVEMINNLLLEAGLEIPAAPAPKADGG